MSEKETAVQDSSSYVETHGTDPVPASEREGSPRGLFPLWFSWNASLLGVSYGIFVLMFGLNWWQAIIAGTLGYLISTFLVGVIAVGGPRTGLPTLTQTRFAFGIKGNIFGTVCSYISSVGWQIVTITVAAGAGANLLARLVPGVFANDDGSVANLALVICFLIVLIVVLFVSVVGFQLITKVETFIAWASGTLTIVFFFIVLPKIDGQAILSALTGTPSAFVGGLILAMTMIGLGFLSSGGDFSRYLPANTKAAPVITWTALGISVPVIGLLIVGVLLAASDPALMDAAAADPIAALANLCPTWFLIPFTIVVMMSLIAGAVMGVYSSGLALVSTGIPMNRAISTAITALLIAAGSFYLLFISSRFYDTFQAFLAIVAVPIGTLAAIQMVDFFRQRTLGWDTDMAKPAGYGGRNYRWTALVSLFFGTILGLGIINSADENLSPIVGYFLSPEALEGFIGATNVGILIAMIAGGALYAILTFGFKFMVPPDYSAVEAN